MAGKFRRRDVKGKGKEKAVDDSELGQVLQS